MGKYIIRRIIQAIPLVIGITIIIFLLMHMIPGGPLASIMANPHVTKADIARLEHNYGLDKPLIVQYFVWLGNMLIGKWGASFVTNRPVLVEILERLGPTGLLMFSSFFISLLIGIPLGIYSAIKRYSFLDYLTTVFSFLGLSMPVFWFGLLMQLLFGMKLHLLPTAGMSDPFGPTSVLGIIQHLILPATVLSLANLAAWSRFMRSGMLEVIQQDYIRTARAKGLTEKKVILKHAFRNALIPIITIIAVSIPGLFSGAIMTEIIFAWPGMGRLIYNSLERMDYPMIIGLFTMVACLVIVCNLIADILYALVDPRIRYD